MVGAGLGLGVRVEGCSRGCYRLKSSSRPRCFVPDGGPRSESLAERHDVARSAQRGDGGVGSGWVRVLAVRVEGEAMGRLGSDGKNGGVAVGGLVEELRVGRPVLGSAADVGNAPPALSVGLPCPVLGLACSALPSDTQQGQARTAALRSASWRRSSG